MVLQRASRYTVYGIASACLVSLMLVESASAAVCLVTVECTTPGGKADAATVQKCTNFTGAAATSEKQQELCENAANSSPRYSNPVVDSGFDDCSDWKESVRGSGGNLSCPEGDLDVGGIYTELDELKQIRGLTGSADIQLSTLIGRIVGWFIAVIGTISLAMFVYAGVNWMVQGGNPEARKKSMQIMVWTVLGVAVIIGSYGIVIWIFNAI